MKNSYLIIPFFLIAFLLFKNKKDNSNVTVSPIVNYSDFLKWYDKTIGDPGDFKYKNQFYDYWFNFVRNKK